MVETVPIAGRVSLSEREAVEAYCRERKIGIGQLVREAVLEKIGIASLQSKREGGDGLPPIPPVRKTPPHAPTAAAATIRAPAAPVAAVYTPPPVPVKPKRRDFTELCPRCKGTIRYAGGELQLAREQHYNDECPALHPELAPRPSSGN